MEFTCSACGIHHCHDKQKKDHTVRHFSVSDDYIAQMTWEPDCHCGLHELLVDVKQGDVDIPDSEFKKLSDNVHLFPVPQGEKETIYSQLENDEVKLTGL